jgi:hypothetical protein
MARAEKRGLKHPRGEILQIGPETDISGPKRSRPIKRA